MDTFTTLFTEVDTLLNTYFTAHVADVMAYVATPIQTMSVVLIVCTGIAMLAGVVRVPVVDLIKAIGVIVIVTQLATNLGNYNRYVADFFLGLPDEVMAVVSGITGTTSVGETLDSFGTAVLNGLQTTWNASSGISSLKLGFLCIVMLIIYLAFAAIVAVSVILAKTVLTILITAGPIFIALLLFKQTHVFFSKWIGYVVQFTMLAMMIGGILAMVTGIMQRFFDALAATNGAANFNEFAGALVASMIGAYLFSHVPAMASNLSGGIGPVVGGLAGGAVASTLGAIKDTGKYGARKTGQAAVGTLKTGAKSAVLGAAAMKAKLQNG